MWYWLFKYVAFSPTIRICLWPKVIGKDNIPASGAAVLAANHQSGWDTVILPAMLHRRVTFPAKAELFEKSWKHPGRSALAIFLSAIGQVPVQRGSRSSSTALAAVHHVLDDGELVGIFPEGTRSRTGQLYRAQTGVAKLILESDVPLIPVGLKGMDRRFPFRPTIVIGEPVRYSDLVWGANDHAVLRWVADDVMDQIRQLSGKTYVDLYGTSVKKGSLSEAEIAAQSTDDPHWGKPRPAAHG